METVASTSDQRTVNNTMRHQYRVLTDAEKAQRQAIKDAGLAFLTMVDGLGQARELQPRQDEDRGGCDVGDEGAHKMTPESPPNDPGITPGLAGAQGIGWAVKQLWNGARVRRAGWNGKGMYLSLQVPDAHSRMTLPYVYIRTVDGDLVPWLCSQTDLLAVDWETAA